AGSFCLCAANGRDGLPLLARTSPPGWADAGIAGVPITRNSAAMSRAALDARMNLLLNRGPTRHPPMGLRLGRYGSTVASVKCARRARASNEPLGKPGTAP